jgi:hypothetical protein
MRLYLKMLCPLNGSLENKMCYIKYTQLSPDKYYRPGSRERKSDGLKLFSHSLCSQVYFYLTPEENIRLEQENSPKHKTPLPATRKMQEK